MTLLALLALLAVQDTTWGPRDYEGKAVARLREGKDYLDEKNKAIFAAWKATCPACDHGFDAARTGELVSLGGADLDGRERFKKGSKYLFRLWMCPKCNYTAEEGQAFEKRVDAKKIRAAIGTPKEYASYFEIPFSDLLRRGEQCLVACEATAFQLGQFLLYGSWMARDCGQKDAEQAFDRRAREKFQAVLDDGNAYKQKGIAALYCAEISRRLGEREAAEKHLAVAEEFGRAENLKKLLEDVARCRELLQKGPEKK